MKKKVLSFIRRWFSLYSLTIGLLNLTAIISFLAFIFNVQYIFTGNPVVVGSKSVKTGMVEFMKGIPVSAKLSVQIPDSSFFGTRVNGGWSRIGSHSRLPGPDLNEDSTFTAGTTHIDTLVTKFRIFHKDAMIENGRNNSFFITGGDLQSGKLYVETKSEKLRFLLLLPRVLFHFVLAFSAWQLARFLREIIYGTIFNEGNYKRLRNIGWAVVFYQTILFALMIFGMNWIISINFESSGAEYHSPVSVSGGQLDYDFDLNWFLGGYILLILASAFQKGKQLQEENDLTV